MLSSTLYKTFLNRPSIYYYKHSGKSSWKARIVSAVLPGFAGEYYLVVDSYVFFLLEKKTLNKSANNQESYQIHNHLKLVFIIMSAQQRMKIANEKASKNITQRGNVVKPVSIPLLLNSLEKQVMSYFSYFSISFEKIIL